MAFRPGFRPFRAALLGLVACLLYPVVGTGLAAAPGPLVGADLAWPGLSQSDVDRMQAAAARLYEGRSIGTVERWFNPDTKNAGEIKLVKSFSSNGMACRELDYVIRFDTVRNSPTRYTSDWCKLPSGDWKIVELPRSR
jgi:surface antigen